MTSASKAWNLAGLKAGAHRPWTPRPVADVGRLHPFVTFGASHLGVIAQTAAYRDGATGSTASSSELDANRHLLAELVAEQLPGVRLVSAGGDLSGVARPRRALGLGDDPVGPVLRAWTGRPLRRVRCFGAGGAGMLRLNFATSPEILREAVASDRGLH